MGKKKAEKADLQKKLLQLSLENAFKYIGKANENAVLGAMLGQMPEYREGKKRGEAVKLVKDIVKKINQLSPDQQTALYEQEFHENPAALLAEKAKKKDEEREKEKDSHAHLFAFLGIKKGQEVVTAFPPGPEKYPHIGHAKACVLNFLLAKEYSGKFYLRFEDTNPKLVKKVFYDVLQDNLAWLGVKWDKLIYASDHMKLYYDCAERLIEKNQAYLCFCPAEKMQENRLNSIACMCRNASPAENMAHWKEFPDYPAAKACLRLKIDMRHKNTTMRDPTMMRTIDEEHARHGKKYRVWPTYDFQTAIMDSHYKVNYRLRSIEFELRNELQRYIQKILGLPLTRIYEFGRLNMVGVLSSGRVIREKVQNKELLGWDDPQLTTLVALRRRGFMPEAIRNFVLSTGITKNVATMTWDDLYMQNRRVLDNVTKRYLFVKDPVKIAVKGAPALRLHLKHHPGNPALGSREITTSEHFYITREDHGILKDNSMNRLMECLNFVKKNSEFVFDSLEVEQYKARGEKIIHWLPCAENLVHVEVFMPDHEVVKGIAEHSVKKLKPGEIIQFERFGFCRLDAVEKDVLKFWWTHN
ncbi:MAG: glutamate--tRNA ligase [Nanoarchaeota archaeon]